MSVIYYMHMAHIHTVHTLMQALMLSAHARKFYCCNLLLSILEEKLPLHCDILWTEESNLTRASVVNVYSVLYWILENPSRSSIQSDVRYTGQQTCSAEQTELRLLDPFSVMGL